MEEHRAALRFDFRHYFGLSLDDVGGAISWGEAIDLVDQLRVQFGSHLQMAEAEWEFAAGYADLMTVLHAEAFINVNRDEKKYPQPVRLPRPWPDQDMPQVTAEERAELEAQLERRSVFAS